MKKALKILCVGLVFSIATVTLAAFVPSRGGENMESVKSKEGTVLKNIFIEKDYGTYNGVWVVMMYEEGQAFTMALWTDVVAGIAFYYNDGNCIRAKVDKQFLTLQQAFDGGFLTLDNLRQIAKIHNAGRTSELQTF